MNTFKDFRAVSFSSALIVAAALLCGCETTGSTDSTSHSGSTPSHIPDKYTATDGRKIEIGRSTADNGGWKFREPHLDKCWIANGFDFKGYDTLYIAPTLSTAKINDDEVSTHQLAKETLVIDLMRDLAKNGAFTNVVTRESDIRAGGHTLKLENTIIKYSQGGNAARYFVGIYGGGQPVLRVLGKMTDGDKVVFRFEVERSGVSVGARMAGVLMSNEDIQYADIRSMVLDLTDFMAAIAGKYPPRN